MSGVRRKRRPVAVAVCAGLVLVSVALGALFSAWFLVAVPFTAAGAYAAWLGLSNGEALDAMTVWDDPGGGAAGMSP